MCGIGSVYMDKVLRGNIFSVILSCRTEHALSAWYVTQVPLYEADKCGTPSILLLLYLDLHLSRFVWRWSGTNQLPLDVTNANSSLNIQYYHALLSLK